MKEKLKQLRRSERKRGNSKYSSSEWKLTYSIFHTTTKNAIETFGDSALKVMFDEMQQMVDKDVFEIVNPNTLSKHQITSRIRSLMFLKEKFNAQGTFEKLKARLVAGGHMQDRDLYFDISSPTASMAAILMVAALAAKEGRFVVCLDIGGAYLNAELNEHEVFMLLDSVLSGILAYVDELLAQ
jgi:hypothetical protein